MKYKGKKLEGRNVEVLVLPRSGENIVFKAEAIPNYEEFEKLIAEPQPPEILKPGGVKEKNVNDPKYKEELTKFATTKTNYVVIKSLQATEYLEWETVDITKPETWEKWRGELEEAGFTEIEIMRIVQTVTKANALDDDMLEEARQSFLLEESLQEK
jgi:hypothetical protein